MHFLFVIWLTEQQIATMMEPTETPCLLVLCHVKGFTGECRSRTAGHFCRTLSCWYRNAAIWWVCRWNKRQWWSLCWRVHWWVSWRVSCWLSNVSSTPHWHISHRPTCHLSIHQNVQLSIRSKINILNVIMFKYSLHKFWQTILHVHKLI